MPRPVCLSAMCECNLWLLRATGRADAVESHHPVTFPTSGVVQSWALSTRLLGGISVADGVATFTLNDRAYLVKSCGNNYSPSDYNQRTSLLNTQVRRATCTVTCRPKGPRALVLPSPPPPCTLRLND